MHTHFFITKYSKLYTLFFIKPFLKKAGNNVRIFKPILITSKYIEIGDNVFIRNGARLQAVYGYNSSNFKPVIFIGDNVSIEQNIHLTCANSIIIGNNTSIASNVTITDIDHPYKDINISPEKQMIDVKSVEIGPDCKIYNNVVILPGAKIGKHCIIGANSVVSGKVYSDYSIIVGSPAKVIKRYNFDTQNWEKTDNEGNFIN